MVLYTDTKRGGHLNLGKIRGLLYLSYVKSGYWNNIRTFSIPLKLPSDWLEKWMITIEDITSVTHVCLNWVPFKEILNG
jgi:hypothetical protein